MGVNSGFDDIYSYSAQPGVMSADQAEYDDVYSYSARPEEQVNLRPKQKPWYARFLEGMVANSQDQAQQTANPPTGNQQSDTYRNMGRGVAKVAPKIAAKLFGFADGGTVPGPTLALLGEGGEPEYVVPQSKVAPWIARTLQDGVPPNPANLPRGEQRPPPPVILGDTPAMCGGGKVVPMADGGYVDPFVNQDPLNYFSPEEQPDFQMPSMGRPTPPVGSIPPIAGNAPVATAPSAQAEALRHYQEVLKQRPIPKWYERALGDGNGGGQLDMRPGVAAYSQGGRALGNVLRSVLPINKKREEYQQRVAEAEMGVKVAQAQDAATAKQAEMARASKVADAQVASHRANEALRNRQLELAGQPRPAEFDRVNVTIGGKATPVLVQRGTQRVFATDGVTQIDPKTVESWSEPPKPTTPSTPSVQEQNQQLAFDAYAEKHKLDPKKLTATQKQAALLDHAKATKPVKPVASGGGQQSSYAGDIAKAIMDGSQPPVFTNMRADTAKIRGELARAGYDLSTAQRDWEAIKRHLSTLNGPQQERLRQAVNFTFDSTDIIEDLYNQWKKVGPNSGWKDFNRVGLAAAKRMPGEAGAVANALEAQINDLTSELGTVYKGGNSSTDESLRLAAQNLKADWNEQTFKKQLDLIRKNLQIRRNSITSSTPAGVSPNSPYAPPTSTQPVANSASGGTIRVRRKSDGKMGSIPAANFDESKYEKVVK